MSAPPARRIIPALIAADREELDRALARLAPLDLSAQLDVMDGRFVPTRSLDFDLAGLPAGRGFEAHLMVDDPAAWVAANHAAAETIIVHFESPGGPGPALELVREQGRRAGLAINPGTDPAAALPFAGGLDHLLVMTVEPGYYGSPFIPEALEKVRFFRERFPRLDLEVDGGITDRTIALAAAAGANLFVSGSFIVKSPDPAAAVEKLRTRLEPN